MYSISRSVVGKKLLFFLSGLLFTAAAVVKGKTAFKAKKKLNKKSSDI